MARNVECPRTTLGKYLRDLDRRTGAGGATETDRVTANLAFVVRMATRYRRAGVPLEDLVNEGNLGLIEAARRYDPARGTRFTTCAVWWVRKAIHNALARQGALVRVPRSRWRRSRADGEPPPVARVLSLEDPIAGRPDTPLSGTLPDPGLLTAEALLLRRESRALVAAALKSLDSRERRVLAGRFGLDGAPARSLRALGREMGLSREMVRQIECRARTRMRRLLSDRGRGDRDRVLRRARRDPQALKR